MAIHIVEYAEEHVEEVRQFNDRLAAGGATLFCPRSPVPAWLPRVPDRKLFQEHWLALDETNAVRGAYTLKHQDFWLKDRIVAIADFRQPISEGAVSKKFPQVGVQLLRDAMARQPLLYGLGIGGHDESLARLFRAAGWHTSSVPFFFRVVHPAAFLKNVNYLQRCAPVRYAINALRVTGLGWLGIHAVQTLRRRAAQTGQHVSIEVVDEFAEWADDLWEQCKTEYGMSAVRDAQTLRILYPRDETRFIRLRVTERSRVIGWAVLLNTQLSGHRQFGNMRLGSIADCCSAATDAVKVVIASREFLERQGVDLIVSNQLHAAWCKALKSGGFLRGPSNFIFAASPELLRLLKMSNIGANDIHVNRGDGDGPIHL